MLPFLFTTQWWGRKRLNLSPLTAMPFLLQLRSPEQKNKTKKTQTGGPPRNPAPTAHFAGPFGWCHIDTRANWAVAGLGHNSPPQISPHTTGGALTPCSWVHVDAFQGVISPPAPEEGQGDGTRGATPGQGGAKNGAGVLGLKTD